jgi:hypothetical protein
MFGKSIGAVATLNRLPWLSPRNLMAAAVAVNILAIVLAESLGEQLIPLRVGVILTGLVLALVAVNHRLRQFGEDVDERATTAGYLALGSFAVLLAYLASSEEWDTFRLVLGVFVAVGLVGAVLVLLPMLVRRTVIIVLVLFHFGGILTAVFSVPPPSGVSCWLTGALWTYVYRPYLQFMYLNNAYHFYSPEPGPATQLWFRISYEDAKVPSRWVRFPRRQDFPSRLSFQRYTAMTESTTYQRVGYPPDFFGQGNRLWRRYREHTTIPYHPDLQADKGTFATPDLSQYREPSDTAKKYIASYARHVARDPAYRSPESPDTPVKTVKVYRVLHTLLTPSEMGDGMNPNEPAKLLPVYVGEFDSDGKLLDPGDPLLYWIVPILREKDGAGGYILKDYVAIHAGGPKGPKSPATED